jgi:hypothetical protein
MSKLRRSSDYDSRPDTRVHIAQVQQFVAEVSARLAVRAATHDASKLESPEVEAFDEFTPGLRATTYGSDEYKQNKAAMADALTHHYAANSHHPEHHALGINGMSLLDLIEMLCDWKASSMRQDDGDIRRSVEINLQRFGIDEQLQQILLNTIEELGWS